MNGVGGVETISYITDSRGEQCPSTRDLLAVTANYRLLRLLPAIFL